jgi:hypothetical protein
MSTVVEAPLELIEAVASLRLPARMADHLQQLMNWNTEGMLTPKGRAELEALVELNETISLVRAQALHLLERNHTKEG